MFGLAVNLRPKQLPFSPRSYYDPDENLDIFKFLVENRARIKTIFKGRWTIYFGEKIVIIYNRAPHCIIWAPRKNML